MIYCHLSFAFSSYLSCLFVLLDFLRLANSKLFNNKMESLLRGEDFKDVLAKVWIQLVLIVVFWLNALTLVP